MSQEEFKTAGVTGFQTWHDLDENRRTFTRRRRQSRVHRIFAVGDPFPNVPGRERQRQDGSGLSR